MTLDDLRREHRQWLDDHNLLDRPWFVLGAAPEPTLPEGVGDRAALICINNVGVTAARLGLPPAELTFRNKNKEWTTLAGCKVPLVLWVCDRNRVQVFMKRMRIRAKLGEIRVMRRADREHVYTHMLRKGATDSEGIGKPSTGVFALLYGLFVGVPEIILGGMSMDKQGYSHPFKRARMMHGEEDRFALTTIARHYPNVTTTEPVIADTTGLPLYRPPAQGAVTGADAG